jgi:hypothetical protein
LGSKKKNGKSARVTLFQKSENSEKQTSKNEQDSPLGQRLFTAKANNSSGLEGALQDRCNTTRFQPGNTCAWKPGQSGNPAGRPRTADLKLAVREFAGELLDNGKPRLLVWLENACKMARQGSSKHLELLLAYGWGRPLQQQITLTADAPSDDECLRELQGALAEIRNDSNNDSKLPVA